MNLLEACQQLEEQVSLPSGFTAIPSSIKGKSDVIFKLAKNGKITTIQVLVPNKKAKKMAEELNAVLRGKNGS